MKKLFLFLCLPAAANASPKLSLHLPPAAFADTEVTTNCPFDCGQRGVHDLLVDMTFSGATSNNVQLAFGRDADADGALAAAETDVTFAWECGEWQLCGLSSNETFRSEAATTNAIKELQWNLRLQQRRPKRLAASENGTSIFPDLSECPPVWLYSTDWNMLRLTVRGVDAPNEDVGVKLNVTGYVINVR